MNLSHAYSDRAPQPKSYLGVSLVVAIHVAAIYAFSAGLIHPPTERKEAIHLLPPIDDKRLEPERPKEPVLKADKPSTIAVPIPEVPAMPWEEAPPVKGEPLVKGDPPVITGGSTGGTGGAVTTVQPPAETLVRTAGAVCSVMPKPELPALNWSGEAVLQVMATVRGARVVGSDFRVAQGALDSKTKRSLQRSVESALAGYQCQGDAVFQQDFAFRLD